MEDLIDEILVCLPVKSLLRFRCVSKSWYQIIHSPCFIHSHLDKSSDSRHKWKLFLSWLSNDTHPSFTKISAIDIKDGFLEDFLLHVYRIPYPCSKVFTRHCNGLVLFCPPDKRLYVLNPSTRHYREIPAFPVHQGHKTPCMSCHVGFGYDPINDDYKIVVLEFIKRSYYEVWIFGFKSNCWRRNPDYHHIDQYDIEFSRENSFLNGFLYFLCSGKRWRPCIIMAFDVAKETFSLVPLPAYDPGQVDCITGLQIVEGCLSIKFCTKLKVDLYVRKKIGVEFIWTKLFSHTTLQSSLYPLYFNSGFRILGYAKEGDKILLSNDERIYSYDLKKTSIERIETSVPSNYLYDFIDCVESLVSVDSESFAPVARLSSFDA